MRLKAAASRAPLSTPTTSSRAMSNDDIAGIFDDIADLLEIDEAIDARR
ncbi:hypothetical protein LOY64_16200 [Pseudomonas corrugata]|jgi:hypothetical protein|nr:hypothetical protein [Pseudomonas corrugata]MDU9022735.1 hypothetical protein [Pseudomonas corrugata]MDU9032219.1 hypothetical protein [Pseudomonas corrugata]MDU9037750.1 hypothetical protein [Pseudomonas corrugata]MDU9038955.1 hypothetical protein [Pseudomonas corrugata]UZD98449.1 hypothetical protein LOY64_16200 [Pseudomonas corrugata]